MTGLEMATLEDIVEELGKRYTGVVIAYTKRLSEEEEAFGVMYRGGMVLATGLIEKSRKVVLNGEEGE